MYLVVACDYAQVDQEGQPTTTIVGKFPTEKQAWRARKDLGNAATAEGKTSLIYAVYSPESKTTADLKFVLL